MFRLVGAITALFTAGIVYFLLLLRKKRAELNGMPMPPMKSWLFGHLDIAGEARRVFPRDIHMQHWPRYMQKSTNSPDVFYIDWWPLGPRWLFVGDSEISSQFITGSSSSTSQSLPKSHLETVFLDIFLGDSNMVSLEGEKWKTQRSMFNPGFSSAHLMTLVPYIVDASLVFRDVIAQKADTNEHFELEESATRLTIDIIGKVVLDSDFDSQKAVHPIVETFRERAPLMPRSIGTLDLTSLQLPRRYKLWRNGIKLDRLIGEELDRKLSTRTQSPNNTTNGHATATSKTNFRDRKRSVVDLALDAYEKQFPSQRNLPSSTMDPFFRSTCIDSMKTFIFAGHDTTASTIAYIFYFLHCHPHVHTKLLTELNLVFGASSTPSTIATAIKSDPYIINNLPYMLAVIKETLRIFPPASTLRSTSTPGLTIPNPLNPSQLLPLTGFDIWPVASLIHRNEKYFPQPLEFIPERFLPNETPFPDCLLHTARGKDAWRPFEKGPRSCIGEQLAMLETKIILALTVKEFDFIAEYDDGVPIHSYTPIETAEELPDKQKRREAGANLPWTVEGHRCYQILKGAAKPVGGMPGRVYWRDYPQKEG